MHARRWLTALLALPVLLSLLLRGPWWSWLALLLLVEGLAHWEFLRLGGLTSPGLLTLNLGVGLLLLVAFVPGLPQLPLLFLLLGLFILCGYFLWHFESYPQLLVALGHAALGLLYVPLLLGHFYWLFELPAGRWWLLWLLGVVFACDTGAFYAGHWWGRQKLYPAVSPGKTVAGMVGGFVTALLAGLGLGFWLFPAYHPLPLTLLSLLLAAVGQLGDLFESMLKRRAQVKDASRLLPGHGGLLDRLDSLGFAGLTLYYWRLFCG